jgi:hypothetical protein
LIIFSLPTTNCLVRFSPQSAPTSNNGNQSLAANSLRLVSGDCETGGQYQSAK